LRTQFKIFIFKIFNFLNYSIRAKGMFKFCLEILGSFIENVGIFQFSNKAVIDFILKEINLKDDELM
jgi:hypothetical protein